MSDYMQKTYAEDKLKLLQWSVLPTYKYLKIEDYIIFRYNRITYKIVTDSLVNILNTPSVSSYEVLQFLKEKYPEYIL